MRRVSLFARLKGIRGPAEAGAPIRGEVRDKETSGGEQKRKKKKEKKATAFNAETDIFSEAARRRLSRHDDGDT